jgi:hypothetical protein
MDNWNNGILKYSETRVTIIPQFHHSTTHPLEKILNAQSRKQNTNC